jgi:hypothetical protein
MPQFAAAGCSTAFDCSLAGQCVDGVCQCEKWALGPTCAKLALEPLSSAAALRPLISDGTSETSTTRWGGSVVRGDDGNIHMFSAEMGGHDANGVGCDLNVWGWKSQVIHSVASDPLGPFTRLGVAIGAEAHNPVISRTTDNSLWLIWTCGCPHPEPQAPGCAKETIPCPGGLESVFTTTVYSSPSLDGPWTAHVNVLGNITGRQGTQNVAPLMRADGSVVLMFKGPDNNTEVSLAVAPHWSGPYDLIATNIFHAIVGSKVTNEDSWFWQSADGYYHAITHRMNPNNAAGKHRYQCGGHGFATSLTNWSFAAEPAYNLTFEIDGGSGLEVSRRERPQLLFGGNGEPAVLYNAVWPNDKRPAFTFAQRIGQPAPTPAPAPTPPTPPTPPPSPTPAVCDPSTFLADVAYNDGAGLGEVPAASAVACCELCAAAEAAQGCRWFSWQASAKKGKCFLKADDMDPEARVGVTSGATHT